MRNKKEMWDEYNRRKKDGYTISDMWKDWEKAKKNRRQELADRNMQIIRQSGIEFEEREYGVFFKSPGKPEVMFYPGKGIWVWGNNHSQRGGAQSFLHWYGKQNRSETLQCPANPRLNKQTAEDDSPGQMWRDYRESQRQEKEARKHENLKILRASTWPFEERGGGLWFRAEGKPSAFFYPTTNKWVWHRTKVGRGNAAAFLKWYEQA
jgi:hypothetical protein